MRKHHQPIDPEQWLSQLTQLRESTDVNLLQQALSIYASPSSQLPATTSSLSSELQEQASSQSWHLQAKALGIADILLGLGLDTETLACALAYPALQAQMIHLDKLPHLNEDCLKLLHDVLQMQSLGRLQYVKERDQNQVEQFRKMLLAMISDVRSVLVILAERVWQLRQAKKINRAEQLQLAQDTLTVYAPLANRLGVWQLKWELEDLCLRYLQPDIYNQIAQSLASKRDERESYLQQVIQVMTETLNRTQVKQFHVTGRVKHIDSIYRKMQRKNANFAKIYDISAIRVLVPQLEDCYEVLSVLQNNWEQISEEFDDYIAHPKPNGYRSIHTVIIGPENRFVEVQIRTFKMHHESELGVAAHWRYKEGVLHTSHDEAKIALLRQIMAWQKEVLSADELTSTPPKEAQASTQQSKPPTQTSRDLFADRVYVFTPQGKIIDLPQGATPLDFAYHIHSEIGHRCRGAKVDGNIVPLTYQLKSGDRVEILTTKQAKPSRDWLTQQLGYLKTSRARSKVQHWFRLQDSIQQTGVSKLFIDKELKRLGISEKVDLTALAIKYNYKTADNLLAALAAGEIRLTQMLHQLTPAEYTHKPVSTTKHTKPPLPAPQEKIDIVGMHNLLTHVARCCKPTLGDDIIGYITRNRGVTIHRRYCANM